MHVFLGILILVILVKKVRENLSLHIAPLLAEILWHEREKTRSRFSAEAEYKVMAHIVCEMMWLKNLMLELGFQQPRPMPMHYDNQFTIYIAQNLVFHERTKHMRFTLIWSEILGLRRLFLSCSCRPQSNWQIFLSKRLHHMYFLTYVASWEW